jgi:hypothetical protein
VIIQYMFLKLWSHKQARDRCSPSSRMSYGVLCLIFLSSYILCINFSAISRRVVYFMANNGQIEHLEWTGSLRDDCGRDEVMVRQGRVGGHSVSSKLYLTDVLRGLSIDALYIFTVES